MTANSAGQYTDIIYEKKQGAAWITINRPDTYNSLVARTILEMTEAVTDAAEDPEIGVIVITGAGEKSFSSGGNLKALNERTSLDSRNHMRRLAHLGVALRTCGKPTIAAVNGYAVGAGHELHVMCDLTIAAEHAKFGQTGPRMGGMPVWGATQLLHRMVGEKKAREIIFMCRLYTAKEALEMGLVNHVVPMAELYPTVEQWCTEILEKSPQCLRVLKLAMNQESDANMWGAFFSGAELFAMHTGSPEFVEGTSARIEKRKPDFGRFRTRARATAKP
ncbi:MAG: enoyl-CoA hydratase/isomerase family protein [Betaproteobacteria bacterium]|nr:enoyl-CoA hydratase/isomerase family protein [Betaproteobacteria bacterium]